MIQQMPLIGGERWPKMTLSSLRVGPKHMRPTTPVDMVNTQLATLAMHTSLSHIVNLPV